MRYLIRWVRYERIHEAYTEEHDTALAVYGAVLNHYANDFIPVSMWKGVEKVIEGVS